MCSVSHALGACQSLCFPQTQAQLHECAGELLSRLQERASTACPGWLCHAIPVEWGEAVGRASAGTRRGVSRPSCLAPSGWEQPGLHMENCWIRWQPLSRAQGARVTCTMCSHIWLWMWSAAPKASSWPSSADTGKGWVHPGGNSLGLNDMSSPSSPPQRTASKEWTGQ